jgi:hypothetical protein
MYKNSPVETEENYKAPFVRPRVCPDTFFEQRNRCYVERFSDALNRWSTKRDVAVKTQLWGRYLSFEALIGSQLIKKVTPSTEPETSLPFSQEKLKLLLCKEGKLKVHFSLVHIWRFYSEVQVKGSTHSLPQLQEQLNGQPRTLVPLPP